MTTLIFSAGGCPSYPFYSFKRGPWYPVFRENPSREVATKDHSSSNPTKGNPPDLKTKVDVSKVDVKGFPTGKKKAHKHKLFCPVGLRTTPGLSRGFHRVCPWDKSGENLGQTRVFSLFYIVEARFHRVCPWDKPGLSQGQSRGRRAAQKVYVKKVYVPFSLANYCFSSKRRKENKRE